MGRIERIMSKLIILGSASAIPDEKHDNTHMVLVGREKMVLIDCANNPFMRLRQAGLESDHLTDIVLTHFHPDHVSGMPSLLMQMWLTGRQRPINIYGLSDTLDRLKQLMGFYDWGTWPNFYQVNFFPISLGRMTLVLENQEFRIYASPVCHIVPTIGLRFEFCQTNKVLAYSCDTEPCPEVVQLAYGADVLIHESTGASFGHSSASQAGGIAAQAESASLYLIHYDVKNSNPQSLEAEARGTFNGPVALAEDFMELDF